MQRLGVSLSFPVRKKSIYHFCIAVSQITLGNIWRLRFDDKRIDGVRAGGGVYGWSNQMRTVKGSG